MERSRPRILVSNDDGIASPGIEALAAELAKLGDVTIVAPDREQSAASHSLTLQVPLRANRLSDSRIGVEGTPTDCVMLAIKHLLDEPPDLLVSGINRGANIGDDITYSGTVAAAMEGTLLGVRSMAVSLNRSPSAVYDYAPAAAVARRIAAVVLERGLPEGTLLNINVPNVPEHEIRGVKITRLGKQVYEDLIVQKTDPRGRQYYWIGGQEETWALDPGTDSAAVAERFVSVTPIHLDLTDYRAMEEVRSWGLEETIDDGTRRRAGDARSGAASAPEDGEETGEEGEI